MKVTYLFGAGASANAIPPVKANPGALDMKQALAEFKKSINSHSVPPELDAAKNDFVGKLDWLYNALGSHYSIDSFAKKLTLRKNEERNLKILKLLTSLFFTYLQSLNPVDKRYDAFFATILKSIDELPSSINIISWNYDFQFELSYKEFNQNVELDEVHQILNIKSKNHFNKIPDRKGFSITKLNGTSIIISQRKEHYLILHNEEKSKVLDHLISVYNEFVIIGKNFNPALSFAWENDPDIFLINDVAFRASEGTEVLVIIGYSFPDFNRQIDLDILRNLPLKRVYFQSPKPENIMTRFLTIRDDLKPEQMIPWSETDQFLIPKELII
jgi:hypothetical protein